jgi:hypothetical protein
MKTKNEKKYIHILNGQFFNELELSVEKFDSNHQYYWCRETPHTTEEVTLITTQDAIDKGNIPSIDAIDKAIYNFICSEYIDGITELSMSDIAQHVLFRCDTAVKNANIEEEMLYRIQTMKNLYVIFDCRYSAGKKQDFTTRGDRFMECEFQKKTNKKGREITYIRLTEEPILLTYCRGFGNRLISYPAELQEGRKGNYCFIFDLILKRILSSKNSKTMYNGIRLDSIDEYSINHPTTRSGIYKHHQKIEKIFEFFVEKKIIKSFEKTKNRKGEIVYHYFFD